MVKKTPLQFVIAFFVAFSLSFAQSQSCYASNSTGIWNDNEVKIITATVGIGGGAALLWWLLRSDDSGASNPSPTNGIPVILSESNYNLLYMAGNGSNGGTSVPGKIYVLNNSDQAATNGFVLTSSSSNVAVSSDSTCSQTVAANAICYFGIGYTASSTSSKIDRTTAVLSVESGASSSDSVTVNTLSVPYNYLLNPTVDDTNAHGIAATVSTYSFATVQKNGVNFVYAATDNGVFKTNDNGTTWLAVNGSNGELTSTNAGSVYALYAIDSVLYAGTDGHGVFSSTDGGATWIPINIGLTGNSLIVNAFASIDGKLYAGTNAGVFVLDPSNPGAGWVQVGSNTDPVYYTLCAVNKILCAGFYGSGVRYYDTTNATADWALVGSNSPSGAAVLYSDGKYLYEGDYYQYGVSRISISSITDGTATWENFGEGLESINVYAIYFINGNLYTGTWGGGVYKIDPYVGTVWTQIILGFRNQSPYIYALYSIPDVASPLLYAGLASWDGEEGGGGIYTTTPVASSGTETWALVSNTLTQLTVYTLFKTDSGTIYAGTYGDGVFKSTDGGANWTPLTNTGLTNLNVGAVAVFGKYLYAGMYNNGEHEFPIVSRTVSTTTGIVFRIDTTSTNATWENKSDKLPGGTTAKAFNVDNNVLSVGIGSNNSSSIIDGGVYTFDDIEWKYANGPSMDGYGGTNAITSGAGTYWASSGYSGEGYVGGVFSNTNPPTVNPWPQLDTTMLTNKNVLSLQYNPNDNYLYAGCGSNTNPNGVAFKISNTDGATWENITGDMLYDSSVNAYCLYKNQLYAGAGNIGSNNGGVYAYGGGTTWTHIDSDIEISVFALQAFNNNLFAGTDDYGVLRATIAQNATE